jgi:hypothetical protein
MKALGQAGLLAPSGLSNRWLLYYEDDDGAAAPNGMVELPAEGYRVDWTRPPPPNPAGGNARLAMRRGALAGAGAAGAPGNPVELRIELQILTGHDQGRRLVLTMETEEQFISWLISFRAGAQQSPRPAAVPQPPRNPDAHERALLAELARELPPEGNFDAGATADTELLRRFWTAFHADMDDAPPAFVPKGNLWKKAGFQRDDPISDLRACGRLALQQLSYFVEHFPEVALPMCRAQQGEDPLAFYPWATAGVSVTQMLCTMMELMQPPGVTAACNEARRPFWAFMGDAQTGMEAFHMLYCLGFELLDRDYVQNRCGGGGSAWRLPRLRFVGYGCGGR